jgi:hypothetical protein
MEDTFDTDRPLGIQTRLKTMDMLAAQCLRTLAPAPSPATDAFIIADAPASSTCTALISLPWSVSAFPSVKGVLYHPDAKPTLKLATRDAILLAIAKARSWTDDLVSVRVQSFDEIAEREGKVERHIRLLPAKSRSNRQTATVDAIALRLIAGCLSV